MFTSSSHNFLAKKGEKKPSITCVYISIGLVWFGFLTRSNMNQTNPIKIWEISNQTKPIIIGLKLIGLVWIDFAGLIWSHWFFEQPLKFRDNLTLYLHSDYSICCPKIRSLQAYHGWEQTQRQTITNIKIIEDRKY